MRGERPLLVVMFAVVAVFAAMLLGPMQSFTSASDRVAELRSRKTELISTVDELQGRRTELLDRDHIELLAREDHGMVRPGEIPYVVTGPNDDVEQLPRLRPTSAPEPESWWGRITAALGRLLSRSETG